MPVQPLWGQDGFFPSSRILSEITKGINYSVRPGRGGNNISKSLMEMQNPTPLHVKWDDGRLEKHVSCCQQPPPFRQPILTPSHRPVPQHPSLVEQPFSERGCSRGRTHSCHLPSTCARWDEMPPARPRHTLNMLVFLRRVILWCSAINYCYTIIINNFLNENDSVDLRCILIIRVKHNYTAALSWHVDSFRAQFCFNTLIM